jgi:hypothetical protein
MNQTNEQIAEQLQPLVQRVEELEAQLADKNTKLADASLTGIGLHADRETLISDVTRLTAENTELRKDKEIVDWLQNNPSKVAAILLGIGWSSMNDAQWTKLRDWLGKLRLTVPAHIEALNHSTQGTENQ